MPQRTNTSYLRNEQYQDATNLSARIQLHQRFSTNHANWFRWVFDHFGHLGAGNILELGCGPGMLWQQNLDRIPPASHIYLSDFSVGMLREAHANTHAAATNLNFITIDAQAIPFPSSRFDLVIANHMLYHVPDRPSAIQEIHRVLKPGGKFVAATNGQNHMAEIHALYSHLDHSLADHFDYAFGVSEFTLENGAAQLATMFADIHTILFPGGLEVTEVEPLISYLHSMITEPVDKTNLQNWDEIHQIIDHEILCNGSFNISKSTGLFIAEKSTLP